jgi:hypothetical protein
MPSSIQASSLKTYLNQMPKPHQVMGLIDSSESHGKFAIDTASNWLPKMLYTVRTPAEAVEVSFLEFVESGFFYYAPKNIGEKVASAPWFQKLASNVPKEVFSQKLLTKSLDELRKHHPEMVKHVVPLKAALILAGIGAAGVAGEYALSFAKNLLTLKAFNKSRFSDIANLTDDKRDMQDPHLRSEIEAQNRKVKQKAYQRLKLAAALGLGIVAGAAGLARFGYRLPGVAKGLEHLVQKFDFKFQNGRFDLSKAQLRAIIALGGIGYLDACRDDLELKETASRLAVVMPYLAYGSEWLQARLVKPMGKLFPVLLNKTLDGKLNYELGYDELLKDSLLRARKALGKSGADMTETTLQQKAKTLMDPLIRSKNALFLISFLIGTFGVGLINTLTAQHFTKLRHQRNVAEKAARQRNQAFASPSARSVPNSLGYSATAGSFAAIGNPFLSDRSALRSSSPALFATLASGIKLPSAPSNRAPNFDFKAYPAGSAPRQPSGF